MLQQNGKRFYKGLYVTFKLVPDLKKNTVYLSNYSPLNEGNVSILTNSVLCHYQWYRRAYNSSINRWNFLKFFWKYPLFLYNDSVKIAKIRHAFAKLQQIVFAKVSLCLQINGMKNTTFQFSVKLISNRMHEAIFKLVLTQRQYVDGSYWVAATNYWWIVGIFLNAEKHFYLVKNALSE